MADLHTPTHPIRLVTASALFDGHDASINIMRRIFMSQGCEVIHLGHNRSVQEVVDAALEEDVQGVAVSSYQGGHVEYFEYLVESLRAAGAGHVRVVGGGGGVIVPKEIERLRDSGVTIFSPEDGQKMGLVGMINSVVARLRRRPVGRPPGHGRAGALRRPVRRRPRDHRRRGRPPRRVAARGGTPRGREPRRARARHHRHRRIGQVEPHRRDRPPLPHRPAGQAPHRGHRGRPDPAQGRRSAARRPDPRQLPRRRPRVLPLAGHPRRARGARAPRRRDRGDRRPPASTSSSSRPPASGRATRASCRSSTTPSTS